LAAAGLLAWLALGSLSGSGSEAGASETVKPYLLVAEAVEVTELDEAVEALEADPVPPAVEPESKLVDVHVASDPTGARIVRGDGSLACASAPCRVEVERGTTLVLRAKLGKRRGRAAITPSQEETVLIELQAPKKTAAKPRSAQAPPRKRAAPARASDLKVPEWAQ
jgi:hypothetical protein